MANKHTKAAEAGSANRSVFETPGGRTYLENLRRLHPTETTKRAVEAARKAAAKRSTGK